MASLRTLMTSGLLLKEETTSVPCGSGHSRRVSRERAGRGRHSGVIKPRHRGTELLACAGLRVP